MPKIGSSTFGAGAPQKPKPTGPVPEGRYTVRIARVDDSRRTKNGDQMWALGMVIVKGSEADRWLNDWLFFNDKGWPRILKLLSACNIYIDLDCDYDLKPVHIKGRILRVDTEHSPYFSKKLGKEVMGNQIPYSSYGLASAPEIGAFQFGTMMDPPVIGDRQPGDPVFTHERPADNTDYSEEQHM